MTDDANAIYAEVEKRKRRAQELGAPKVVWELFEHVRHYPSYLHLRNDPPGYDRFVPSAIAAVEEPAKDNVSFVYEGVRYSFAWSATSVDSFFGGMDDFETLREDGRLILSVNDERVFELVLRGEQALSDEYVPTTWEPRGIEAFVEGAWLEHLRVLNKKVSQHLQSVHQADAKKRREDPAKLADLRDRFGIK
jgi:hypothetical protein